MNRTTYLGQGLTQGMVEDLYTEAVAAGDLKMVDVCSNALECDQTALRECARVIAEAAARKGNDDGSR
jgi:hypothetical protein